MYDFVSCHAVQRSPPAPKEQQRLMVFHSSYSGEELFQQWVKHHPAVVKRYEELRSPNSSVKVEQNDNVDHMQDQNSKLIDSELS